MLLIIDNYDSFTYNLYQAIATYYDDVRVIRNDKITISELKAMRPIGIVLSPGPGRPEEAGICINIIKSLIAGDISFTPLLGVCLGHQAITVALGGYVVQSKEISHGKEDLIYHYQTGLHRLISMPFKAGRYHSLIAERASLPSELLIDAENKQGIVMSIRHTSLPIYGVQFHPESILTPEGSLLLREFVDICTKQIFGVAA